MGSKRRKKPGTEPLLRAVFVRSLVGMGYGVFLSLYGWLWWKFPRLYFSDYVRPATEGFGHMLYGSVFYLLFVFGLVQFLWRRMAIGLGTIGL